MEIMEEIGGEEVGENMGVEWRGVWLEEKEGGGERGMVVGLVLMLVFLLVGGL